MPLYEGQLRALVIELLFLSMSLTRNNMHRDYTELVTIFEAIVLSNGCFLPPLARSELRSVTKTSRIFVVVRILFWRVDARRDEPNGLRLAPFVRR